MSTIFGHGRLRLYLLKLLDESPRHGYEIISLLRDRFLGVYSPSPGTIYPRLARLEEEGLVTHEEVNGRKVYRLTDKGRAELHRREADLHDLERELTDSVRDVARAVREDVRDTISSLREELKFAAGGGRRPRPGAAPSGASGEKAAGGADTGQATGEKADAPGTADAAGAADGTADGSGAAPGGERERSGAWWERDWERFAQGFGAFGAGWTRRGAGEHRPEFEHALRDFTERVRDVVRDAGHVGESAARDLRRILDETVEVIRRDARSWGPREDEEGDRSAGSGEAAGPAAAPEPEAAPKPEPAAEAPRPTGDPWSAAVNEDGTTDGTTTAPKPGPAAEAPRPTGDSWATAVNEDGGTDGTAGTGDAAGDTPGDGTGDAAGAERADAGSADRPDAGPEEPRPGA
ncbi:PadR family transcriptional regulator [Nocardiopsis trehalosi]|uniref:PadR family transcriptional regulator n=1 Tax=Nocardiopsis trehalosi TaxID=109329 RepID=UPI0009FBDCAF|nr:PadR family transcriptional regulator [Nocardiopsis trehalosi]